MTELPLIIFTLLSQMAVGALGAVTLLQIAGKLPSTKTAGKIGWIVFVIADVSLLVSIAHLGQPLRAINALHGLGSSPLSLEILFFALFAGCVLLYALFETLGRKRTSEAFGGVGTVVGLVAVGITSACYMLPGVPAWDSFITPLQFYATVVLVGVPFGFALFSTMEKTGRAVMWWSIFVVLFIVMAVLRVLYYSNIQTLLMLTLV